MKRIRLPLRLARREVRRRPGRTLLVALLVGLPVAGMVLAVTLIRTDAETPLEEWTRSYGQAEAAGFVADLDPAVLPADARLVEVRSTYARVKSTDGIRTDAELTDLPLADPVAAGIHHLVAGRARGPAGEVALSTRWPTDCTSAWATTSSSSAPTCPSASSARSSPRGCFELPAHGVRTGRAPRRGTGQRGVRLRADRPP